MRKYAFLLAFLPIPVAAQDQFYSGNQIYKLCESDDAADKRACAYFIVGVSDALAEVSRLSGGPGLCYNEHVTAGQVFDVTVKYFRDNPEIRHASAAGLVANAIAGAFPCPKP